MKYYQAGYYLIKLKEANYGSVQGYEIFTVSECLNDNYLESWSLPWTVDGKKAESFEQTKDFTQEQLIKLQKWVDEKFNENQLGWSNVFYSLDALNEYKTRFYSGRTDLHTLGLSFEEQEAEALIKEYEPQGKDQGEIGKRHILNKRTDENSIGKFLGYDVVGVEIGGSFHTLYCHELQDELSTKFGAKFNDRGLIDSCENWKGLIEYCNADSTGLEPVP